MNITILNGRNFEKEWRKQLAYWKEQKEENNKRSTQAIAEYMATGQRKIKK